MRYAIFGAIALALFSCGTQLPEIGSAREEREAPPELQELSWLVGNWTDQSDLVDVDISWDWDEDMHFLQQQFSVLGEDDKVFTGRQILGWDPRGKEIRSWIFDSSGGFGQSEWHKEGNDWYAETIYTIADGKRATATHVYRKVDDNSYTFSSESRDIDGQLMPNMGPFKMVRS